jgi:DNA-binding FadR family transcriptional regulator
MSAQIETTSNSGLSEDEVLRQIEQAVLDHRLPPGTKLKEVQLANLFGVKRGLIRKVLTRLAHSRLGGEAFGQGRPGPVRDAARNRIGHPRNPVGTGRRRHDPAFEKAAGQ